MLICVVLCAKELTGSAATQHLPWFVTVNLQLQSTGETAARCPDANLRQLRVHQGRNLNGCVTTTTTSVHT
jgi:hypothetical protein